MTEPADREAPGGGAPEDTASDPGRGSPPPGRRGCRGCLACIAGALAVTLLVLALGFLLRGPILRGYGGYFMVEDSLRRGDFIFLLNGGVNDRPFTAAELYREGWAPRVVLSRAEVGPAAQLGIYPVSSQAAVAVLRAEGVPDSAIVLLDVPGGAGSTYAEAVTLGDYLDTAPADTVILVTSPFHTRRARWVFREVLGDRPVQLIMRPAHHNQRYDETDWWQREDGLLDIFRETVKLVLYRWWYG